MKVSSVCWIAAMTVTVSAAQAGTVLDRIRDRGAIVIAHRESSVPFSYLDADKKPVGYAMDLCLNIASALRRKLGLPSLPVKYVMVTSANRIDTIAQGKADLE